MSTPAPTDDVAPPGALKLALIMVGLCLAVFLTGMDQTILATAAPTISNSFHALDDLGWWTNIYLLCLSSFQLFYGKLYSLFSIRVVYLCAIGLFELGSLVCTTAPNSNALIVGRALAGLGAAGIFSGGILITTKVIPLAKRPAYLGIMSGFFGLAAIIGPFVGGALTDSSTWRWCFGINLPLGALAIGICIIFVRTPHDPNIKALSFTQKLKQFDLMGTVLMVAFPICLLLALQWGGSTYAWDNGRIIALLVIAGVLLIIFVLSQTMSFNPGRTLSNNITKNYNIWLAALYAMCITGAIYVSILYIPVWFQVIRGKSALASGVLITPMIVGYVVGSVIAGAITAMLGYYNPPMILGTILMVAGSATMVTIHPETSVARIVGYQLILGFGAGFGFGQPSYIVQTLLPSHDIPIGVTLITLVQNLSASVFVAVGQSIFQNTLTSSLSDLITVNPATVLHGGAGDVLSQVPPDDRAAATQSYSNALIHPIYVAVGLSALSIVGALGVKWVSMKGQQIQPSAAPVSPEKDGEKTPSVTEDPPEEPKSTPEETEVEKASANGQTSTAST